MKNRLLFSYTHYNHHLPLFIKPLIKFSRPHTLIGTSLSIPSIYLYTNPSSFSFLTTRFVTSLLHCMLCSILIHICITGTNQLTDTAIDHVNKPYLPIVSGELSKTNAKIIVVVCFLSGIFMAFRSSSPYLLMVILSSSLIGFLYSIPPFRFKRNPILSSLSIMFIRGIVINVGFYLHALTDAYGITTFNLLQHPKCFIIASYFTFFGLLTSIVKDIPDIHGDFRYKIESLSVIYGTYKMFNIANTLLHLLLYTASSCIFFTLPFSQNISLRLIAFIISCFVIHQLHIQSRTIDPSSSNDLYNYYMFLWKIFYISYIILPLLQ